MTQNAVVTKIIDRRTAEVEVERGTACGGNCGACEACVFQNVIRAVAFNKVSALPGQQVVIESKTGDVMSAAMLLYIVPFVLLTARRLPSCRSCCFSSAMPSPRRSASPRAAASSCPRCSSPSASPRTSSISAAKRAAASHLISFLFGSKQV